ncbi:transcriptional regulator ATRX isoform X2 [Hydra vulgaris]|uniref:transcriptional regulator ATRX isoform X2 n=1 Tax=Hydra vulgaris TaxID=6087 RepID=UPI001F5F4223|nr:transcriptional regulator ATRX isoform X2 [Hydra vulgaris]
MATTPQKIYQKGKKIDFVVHLIDNDGENHQEKEVNHSIDKFVCESKKEQEIPSINLVSPTPDEKKNSQFFSDKDVHDKDSANTLVSDNNCSKVDAVNSNIIKDVAEKVPEFVFCTTCDKKLNINRHKICKHPVLAVVICRSCLNFVNSTTFTHDEIGVEEQCTWCGDGGNLVCCDYCEKAYCKYCIKRNLGKDFLKAIVDTSESLKWKCLVCDKNQIELFVKDCSLVMNYIANMQLLKEKNKDTILTTKITSEINDHNQNCQIKKNLSKESFNNLTEHKDAKSNKKSKDYCRDESKIKGCSEDKKKSEHQIESKTKQTNINSKNDFGNESSLSPDNLFNKVKKIKKQKVIVLSSEDDEDDSDTEIVVLKKSGKRETISKTTLNMVKKLVKISLQEQENQEKFKTNKPKKTLNSFLRLKFNKKNVDIEDDSYISDNKSCLSDHSDTEHTNVEINFNQADNSILPTENIKIEHVNKSSSQIGTLLYNDLVNKDEKKSDQYFSKKKVNQDKIKKITNDDQQPGPSGVRPRNKMQKIRELASKKHKSSEITSEKNVGSSINKSNKSDQNVSSNYIVKNEFETKIFSEPCISKLNDISEDLLIEKGCNKETVNNNYMGESEISFSTEKKKNIDKDNLFVSPDKTSSSLLVLPIQTSIEQFNSTPNDDNCNSSCVTKSSNESGLVQFDTENFKILTPKVVVEKLPSSSIKTVQFNPETSNTKVIESSDNVKIKKSTSDVPDAQRKHSLRKRKSNLIKTDFTADIEDQANDLNHKKFKNKNEKVHKTKRVQITDDISDVSSQLDSNDSSSEDEEGNSDEEFSEQTDQDTDESFNLKHKIVSSDSEENNIQGGKPLKKRRKICMKVSDEDSDCSLDNKTTTTDDDDENTISKSKKRKRLKSKKAAKKKIVSDSDSDIKAPSKGRKKIRKILKDNELNEETIRAREVEEQRKKRLLERINEEKKNFEHIISAEDGEFVLERNTDQQALVSVNIAINKHLKPHQRKGVQFMYDCCIESVKNFKKGDEGGGCLLAHCMGLGKTLQIVAFIHTMINSKNIQMKTFIVIAPLNTVLNWEQEFEKWLTKDEQINIYVLSYAKDKKERVSILRDWYKCGGVLILGYEMYRNLVNGTHIRSKKTRDEVKKFLVEPGPELVVCDEGHVLRNVTSAISKAVNSIATKRRIVLTGTPLQNNLPEYHCMVDFVKPKLLGTKKEFLNRFVNPIKNGQCSNSTPSDVRLMKQRCHVLYQMLSGCVQRQDYSVLTPFLPPKREFTIFVRLHEKQIQMYKYYLENFVNSDGQSKIKGVSLFSDFQCLSKIWTHPWALHLERERQRLRDINKEDSIEEFLNDSESSSGELSDVIKKENSIPIKPWSIDTSSEEDVKIKKNNKKKIIMNDTSSSDSSSDDEVINKHGTYSRQTRSSVALKKIDDEVDEDEFDKNIDNNIKNDILRSGVCYKSDVQNDENDFEKDWYDDFLIPEDQHNNELSGKLILLCEILADAEVVGDKVLVFSQSLCTLNLIEATLSDIQNDNLCKWCHGVDYFRMDGSTSVQKRTRWAEIFNDPKNERCRLFLISTRAGSLGINMVGANRVIIFDCSWNPSHDVQSVFRVYRFGQEKPVYVYRFVAQGTMEEKIYERQITKLATAGRVVDEQQIERHFSEEEIRELYLFAPEPIKGVSETPQVPKDPLLADVVQRLHPKHIVRYHEHDILLENVESEELNEEERKQAWKEYEKEKESATINLNQRQQTASFTTENQLPQFERLLHQPQAQIQNHVQFNESSNVSQPNRIYIKVPPGISVLEYSNHLQNRSRMEQYARDIQMPHLGYVANQINNRHSFSNIQQPLYNNQQFYLSNQRPFNIGTNNRSMISTSDGRYVEMHNPKYARDISIMNPFSYQHRLVHPADHLRPLSTFISSVGPTIGSSTIGPQANRFAYFSGRGMPGPNGL